MKTDTGIALVDKDEDGVDRAFRADVLKGLRQRQKAVPARWFYDEEGSRLFEQITQVEEYYPTRAETEILEARGEEFAESDRAGQGGGGIRFGQFGQDAAGAGRDRTGCLRPARHFGRFFARECGRAGGEISRPSGPSGRGGLHAPRAIARRGPAR